MITLKGMERTGLERIGTQWTGEERTGKEWKGMVLLNEGGKPK